MRSNSQQLSRLRSHCGRCNDMRTREESNKRREDGGKKLSIMQSILYTADSKNGKHSRLKERRAQQSLGKFGPLHPKTRTLIQRLSDLSLLRAPQTLQMPKTRATKHAENSTQIFISFFLFFTQNEDILRLACYFYFISLTRRNLNMLTLMRTNLCWLASVIC